MDLASFAKSNSVRRGTPCALSKLPAKLQAEVRAGIGSFPHSVIARWLKTEHDIQIDPQSLGRHARNGCVWCNK